MKKIIIHPVLAALYPIIFLWDRNSDLVTPKNIIIPVIVVFLTTIFLFFLTNLKLKNKQRTAILVSAFLMAFFSFGHYLLLIMPALKPASSRQAQIFSFLFLIFWLILFLSLSLYIINTKKLLNSTNLFLNIFFLALVLWPLFNLFSNIYSPNISQKISNKLTINNTTNNYPDIYYIILDGYARNDILKNIYNYNNNFFTRSLSDIGFYIADKSYSNYPQTYLSISSTLNMDYIDKLLINMDQKSDDRGPLREIIKNNQIYDYLKKLNYTFVGLPITWGGVQDNQKIDIEIKESFNVNDFTHLLLNTTPIGILGINNIIYKAHRKKIIYNFESLPEIAKYNISTFTYVHLLTPHPPFLFDNKGIEKNPTVYTTGEDGDKYLMINPGRNKYISEYVEQLQFINVMLLGAIKEILANSKTEPIIIVQSDHGPGLNTVWESPSQTNMPERLAILNAYYLPPQAKEQLYPSISPVNSFRIVLNSLFNAELDILSDKSYFATWSRPYDYIDVTNQLKR